MNVYDLGMGREGFRLSLIISTNLECYEVEAKGPDVDSRNKCVTWGLWLPYEEIVRSGDQTEAFISKFFEAAGIVFATYGIGLEVLKQAKTEVESEIIGNQHYL